MHKFTLLALAASFTAGPFAACAEEITYPALPTGTPPINIHQFDTYFTEEWRLSDGSWVFVNCGYDITTSVIKDETFNIVKFDSTFYGIKFANKAKKARFEHKTIDDTEITIVASAEKDTNFISINSENGAVVSKCSMSSDEIENCTRTDKKLNVAKIAAYQEYTLKLCSTITDQFGRYLLVEHHDRNQTAPRRALVEQFTEFLTTEPK